MSYQQKTDCASWQFDRIPAFTKGDLSPLFADCGAGLDAAEEEDPGKRSFMHLFTGAAPSDIEQYARLLTDEGFTKTDENRTDGNLFYEYRTEEGVFTVTYLKANGTARFILDRCRQDDAPFGYGHFEEKRGDTVFAQYSLHFSHMIRGTTCDCGMNYVYRLRDNSLLIIDGGEMEQATDIAVGDYMAFLHELTGTKAGEAMRVSLWICTHAHNDHCDFFSKLIRFYPDELIVERAAFNFPAPENVRHSPSVLTLRQRLTEVYPAIKYKKLHAGLRFQIANAGITVLTANEDTIGIDEEDLFLGMNCTSAIFTVEAEGLRTLFLADCGDQNGEVLINNYGEEVTSSAFLQAAHHGINEIPHVYKALKTEKILLPQCRMNMDTRFSQVYRNLCDCAGEENILFAHDRTDIFTLRDGECTHTTREHTGAAYDGSEW